MKKQTVAMLILFAVAVATTSAQGDARFSGTVLDQTGAFVPGAIVTIKNQKTGEVRTVTTNSEGRYAVANLRPSVYTIDASFGSFQPLEYTDMTLAAGQEFSLDLELHAAGVTETVTVEGRVNTIDLSSARIGANVSEREVQELPVNGRQMSQLLLQAPGSQNAGTGTWQDIRFSGRAVEQNVIKYDGIEGSAIIDAAPGNVNGENNTPFSCRRASRMSRSSASNRAAIRPSTALAPVARSASSPSPGATTFTARCSTTCAAIASTRATTSTRRARSTAA
ncbi:MAG: hypothetical protein DMF87_08205 [Acidobacteria bacterium]|nr:MAG: hypothetical protein DMF87_08205 [Acidobacteriota bacterium]